MPQKNILRRRERGDEGEFLVDGDDAAGLAGARRADGKGGAREAKVAGIGSHRPAQDFEECGLAGAVFPDQRVDLARLDLEIHAGKSLHAAVPLGQTSHGE